jgi:hypothetical protein
VRGRIFRSHRCSECVQNEEAALERESHKIARDHARAKAIIEYFRGERSTPYTDQEASEIEQQRSARRQEDFDQGRRLHPYSPAIIDQVVSLLYDQVEKYPDNLVLAYIPGQFVECVRLQEEIDATGREITDEDWLHSYRAIRELLLTEVERSLPDPPQQAEPPAPLSFSTFTAQHH